MRIDCDARIVTNHCPAIHDTQRIEVEHNNQGRYEMTLEIKRIGHEGQVWFQVKRVHYTTNIKLLFQSTKELTEFLIACVLEGDRKDNME